MIREIDLSPDETIGPKRIDEVGASLPLDLTTVIGAAPVDDGPLKEALVIGLPVGGERTSGRSCFKARGRSAAHGTGEPIRAVLNGLIVLMDEAVPDSDLPAPVEVFDECLEARLVGRREDGGDIKLQAEADYPPEGVAELTRSTKDRVVVELDIV